jgi:hypothetical protein
MRDFVHRAIETAPDQFSSALLDLSHKSRISIQSLMTD